MLGSDIVLVREKLEALIVETIRPLVQADGGQVEVVSADTKGVVIRLSGMCAGCPGSVYTTSRIIEPLLKKSLGNGIAVQFEIGPACNGAERLRREGA